MSELVEQVVKVSVELGVCLIGCVKWFDMVKGYGFVVFELVEGMIFNQDVMMYVFCLCVYGENFVDEDFCIICDIVECECGWQVFNIIEMDCLKLVIMCDQGEVVVYECVIVKWFNFVQGFGFVNCNGDVLDIFIYILVM